MGWVASNEPTMDDAMLARKQEIVAGASTRAGRWLDPVSVLARRGTQKRVRTPRAAAREAPTAQTRRCPACGLGKAVGQFIDGSELCVDCRDA